jgi:drug/metabolite transporter (DMT)-like permease
VSLGQWGWLIVLSVLWGGSFFFVGVAVDTVPTLTLVFVRVALAACVLVLVVAMTGKGLPRTFGAWMPFAVMALLNNIIPFNLIALGQSEIASGLASVLNATTPLWGVIIAHLFTTDEKMTGTRLGGVVLGLVGVGILMGPAVLEGRTSTVFGMLCVTCGAISYGFSGLWGRRLRETPALVTATAQLICSSIMLLPVALVIDQPWQLAMPGPPVLAALVGLAVLSTALAYIVFFHILSVSGGTNVMLVTLLIPVSSIFLGVLFLDEVLKPQHIIGALTIAAALIVFDGRAVAALRRHRAQASN